MLTYKINRTLKNMLFLKTIFLLLAISFHPLAVGESNIGTDIGSDEPLQVDAAYRLSIFNDSSDRYLVEFFIEPNYYLYKDKLSAVPQPVSIEFSDNIEILTDQFFGEQEVYRNFASFAIEMPAAESEFIVNYQGCWDGGLCYPLQSRLVKIVDGAVEINNLEVELDTGIYGDLSTDRSSSQLVLENSHQYYLNNLRRGSSAFIILLFFLAGLGLTFTPCVLPMLPIISGIVTRKYKEKNTLWRRLSLSLTYVAVMSLMFSILGLFSGLLGYGLRDLLGSQIFILAMATLVTALGFSMLNLLRFPFPLPAFINTPVQKYLSSDTGAYSKAAIWGFLSPFIVGTCLSAPLAAALIYLAELGNPWLGVWSLLALGWGMGLPLLLFAAGLGQFMPRSGPWLEVFRNILGLSLFALAVFIISPLLPSAVEVFGYILIVATMLYMTIVRLVSRPWALAVAVVFSLALGLFYISYASQEREIEFEVVDNYDVMQEVLADSAAAGIPQLFYYYADWCISCRELEWLVFGDAEVQERLAEINLIKLDITKSSGDSRLMVQHFNIIGPPTIIFVDADGEHRQDLTLIGNFDKASFITRLESISP